MNMREMQKIQQKILKMQEELEQTMFTGTAGGGAVAVTMNGKFEISTIKIDPEAFNPEDIGELEAMIVAAARDAQGKANQAQERLTMSLTGGMKLPGLF
jgi:DNA-binding YbaB/EbfC family protein